MFLVLAAVIALVVTVICFELTWDRKAKACARKIAGPAWYPIVGNGHWFIGSSVKFRETLNHLFREYGDRTRVFLGLEFFIIISNPQDIEAITSKVEYIDKSQVYDCLKPWLGLGLLTSTGEKWKLHRRLLTPSFHFKILQDFVSVFEKNSDILVKQLAKNCLNQNVFDIFPYITLCALDDICETAMGVSIDAQKNANSEYVKAVTEMSVLTNYRMRHFLLRYEFFFNFSQNKVRQTKALKTLHSFSENVIRDRQKQLEENGVDTKTDDGLCIKKRTTFLDLLLNTESDGKGISDECIREEVDTFMFEGHDTTTSAISFALHLISKHPDVQKKLFTEQDEIFGEDMDRDATYNDLNNMKYMELVIKESLRLYPSVPLMARGINSDTVVNGMELPAGTTVMIDVYHLHRNPKLYDNPNQFIPERFEVVDVNRRSPYSYVAFSAGPRNCIGQKFAMLEVKSTLSRVLRSYELTWGGREPDLHLDLILKPANGIHVSIKPRNTKLTTELTAENGQASNGVRLRRNC